jgi:hypothetical protein
VPFSTLIGGTGVYAVTPAEPSFVWGGYYEPGSLIWRSRWVTTAQEIECREALSMPGDPHTAVALRRVLAIDGDTQVRVFFDPRAGFGRRPAGLLTEEYDITQRQVRGNAPQAFVHALLLESAQRLAAPWPSGP